MVTHCQVTLPYLIITLANLQVSPGGIQDITLAHLPLHAAAVQTSSESEFKMSSMGKVSSSSEPLSSLVFPKKTTSGEPEQYRSRQSESPPDDPVLDSDWVGLELPKLDTLESEVCDLGLGLGLEPRE